MKNMPIWTKWAAFVVFIAGTLVSLVVWAHEAHTDNAKGVLENRTRLEQNAADHSRIEAKIDKLIDMHLEAPH